MQKKKPTHNQRKVIAKHKLDTYKWMVVRELPDQLEIVNSDTGEMKVIAKA